MNRFAALILLLGPAPAAAEVVSASPNGLEIRQTVDLTLQPNGAYRGLHKRQLVVGPRAHI